MKFNKKDLKKALKEINENRMESPKYQMGFDLIINTETGRVWATFTPDKNSVVYFQDDTCFSIIESADKHGIYDIYDYDNLCEFMEGLPDDYKLPRTKREVFPVNDENYFVESDVR